MIELAETDWRYGPRMRVACGRAGGVVGDGLGLLLGGDGIVGDGLGVLVGGDGIVGDGLGMLVIASGGVAVSTARQAERIARAMMRTTASGKPETTAKTGPRFQFLDGRRGTSFM